MKIRARAPRGLSLAERLWFYLPKGNPDECWIWTGPMINAKRKGGGYGQIIIKKNGKLYYYTAHRVSWTVNRGPIPDGMEVLHSCDNPPCGNYYHLFLGTQVDNVRDAVQKGRMKGRETSAKGMNHYLTRLTDDKVLEIRRLRRDGLKLKEIAARFDLTVQHVSKITRRVAWRHLP